MFVDGMEIWYVVVNKWYHVQVEVKIYNSFNDHNMPDTGNAYHTRDEAEARAEQIRQLFKAELPSLIKEPTHAD